MKRETKLLLALSEKLCNEIDTRIDLYLEQRTFLPKRKNYLGRVKQNRKNTKELLNQINQILDKTVAPKDIVGQAKLIFSWHFNKSVI